MSKRRRKGKINKPVTDKPVSVNVNQSNDITTMEIDDLQELKAMLEKLIDEKTPSTKTKRTRKKNVKKDVEEEAPVQSRRINKTVPNRATRKTKVVRTKNNKGVQARVEPINVSAKRPNLFISSGLNNLHKEDIEIDKKLKGKNVPTDRRPQAELVEAQCSRCGSWWETQASFCLMTNEGLTFVCDDCSGRR